MIVLAILLILIIAFVIAGIAMSKHNLKKDTDDLLNYFKKNINILSITIKEDGLDTFTINPNKRYPLASTLKVIVAMNFVKLVNSDSIAATEKVAVDYLDKFYIENTDGGAHPKWKESIDFSPETSLLEIAKGMMQYSSNACTDFLISRIGIEVINNSIKNLQLNDHDKITYLTPSVLIPGYLADKPSTAIDKIKTMDLDSYQELSADLFEEMEKGKCDHLKNKASKMLSQKIQLFNY